MRFQQYLVEQELLLTEDRMPTFLDMVKRYFHDFVDDVARLSKFVITPWAKKVDVIKLERQGWKVIKHTAHGDHELWLLKKGSEEKLMGY